MAGSVQKSVILAKPESTLGSDAGPNNTDDALAIRVTNLSAKNDPVFVDRDVITGVLAGNDKVEVTRRASVAFSVDFQGSGTPGVAPAWGKLLQACGMAETVTPDERVDYTPISVGMGALTIWAYINGRLEKYTFCMGSFTPSIKGGQLAGLDFTFKGLVSDIAASVPPTPALNAWVKALPVNKNNTSQIKLGCDYVDGALTGGTGYNFQEFTLDAACDVQYLNLVNPEIVGIFGRSPTAKFVADFSGAQHAALVAAQHAGTLQSVGLVHGTEPGKTVMLFAPAATLTGVADNTSGAVMLSEVSLVLRPSSVGNDDFRIVAL